MKILGSMLYLVKVSIWYKVAWHCRTHQAQHARYTLVRLAYHTRTPRLDTSGGDENLWQHAIPGNGKHNMQVFLPLQASPGIYLSLGLPYLARASWLMFLIATTIFGSMLDLAVASMVYKIDQRYEICQPYHFIYVLVGLAFATRTIRLAHHAKPDSEKLSIANNW